MRMSLLQTILMIALLFSGIMVWAMLPNLIPHYGLIIGIGLFWIWISHLLAIGLKRDKSWNYGKSFLIAFFRWGLLGLVVWFLYYLKYK